MPELVVPAPVPLGASVRVVSPSWPTIHYHPERTRRAEEQFTGLGYRVSYGKAAASITEDGASAGSPQERAEDLMQAFSDPDVDVVFSAAGGGTAAEILPLLDLDVIRAHPKPFVGYCDNVWINHQLYEAGLVSYHGLAFVAHMGEPGGIFPEVQRGLREVLHGGGDLVCVPHVDRTNQYFNWQDPALEPTVRTRNVPGGWHWIRHGRAKGPFLGGELQILPEVMDHFGFDLGGSVLFWEVAPTTRKTLPFMLAEVSRRSDLSEVAAMVVGADMRFPPREWARKVTVALEDLLGDIPFPVVVNADLGHVDPVWVLPYGLTASVDSIAGLSFRR